MDTTRYSKEERDILLRCFEGQKVKCPRCGGDMILRELGNGSAIAECSTKNCLRLVHRGI